MRGRTLFITKKSKVLVSSYSPSMASKHEDKRITPRCDSFTSLTFKRPLLTIPLRQILYNFLTKVVA